MDTMIQLNMLGARRLSALITGERIANAAALAGYTDPRQGEGRSRQSERDLQRIIDSIPSIAWSANGDGSFEVFNEQWIHYTGLSPSEAINGGWQASFHPEDYRKVVDKWLDTSAAGEAGEIKARMRRFTGEYRFFLIRITPLRDEAGKIVRWYGVCTDIDDLEQAEAWLAGDKRILDMIASADPLPAILDAICRVVEELTGGCLASILLWEPDGKRLRHCAAPSLSPSYTEAVDRSLASPTPGSHGAAAYQEKKYSFLTSPRTHAAPIVATLPWRTGCEPVGPFPSALRKGRFWARLSCMHVNCGSSALERPASLTDSPVLQASPWDASALNLR